MEHSSAAAVTVSNVVDTELIAYFAVYEFWVRNASKYPLLAPLAQDLLSAPASEAYVEPVFLSGELTAGRRNQLTKSQEKQILKLLVNISGARQYKCCD